MAYLLDTNVLSEFLKKTPNEGVLRWFRDTDENEQYVSTLTIGELQKGVSKLPASRRKNELQTWLDSVIGRYDDRILAPDIATAKLWGRLLADLERKGRPIPAVDSLIAATALAHDLILVTRNVDDFAPAGVKTLDLWI